MERGRAYLLSSGWVQELPRRSGRHIRFQVPESNRYLCHPESWFRDPGLLAVHISFALRPDFARVQRSAAELLVAAS